MKSCKTTVIANTLSITDLKVTKYFLSNLHQTAVTLKKSPLWEDLVYRMLTRGLRIMLLDAGKMEENVNVYEVFVGFNMLSEPLYYAGTRISDEERIREMLDNDPDFIPKETREQIVEELLEDVKKYDFDEDEDIVGAKNFSHWR